MMLKTKFEIIKYIFVASHLIIYLTPEFHLGDCLAYIDSLSENFIVLSY